MSFPFLITLTGNQLHTSKLELLIAIKKSPIVAKCYYLQKIQPSGLLVRCSKQDKK